MNDPSTPEKDSKGVSAEVIQRKPFFYHQRLLWLIAIVAGIILFLLYRHFSVPPAKTRTPSVPVVLATAQKADVPVYLSGLGSVTPTYSVTVKTQVDGQLLQVLFREGQMVKADDLIAKIDPRPFQAQVLQFEGQLMRDLAQLANAQIDLKRYQTLYPQKSISQQTLATQEALVQQLQGTVKLDQGQLAGARVNLAYCSIRSPINGRVGLRLVDPGNFVQTSDTAGIAIINMLQPITAIFTIPEDNIPHVIKQMNAGHTLIAKAYNRAQNQLLATGELLTIDNQIDPTTGTVKLKAQFANQENQLFPDQFVNIQLLVDTLKQAIIVPTAAIQYGTNGQFVYLYHQNNTVKVLPVTVGITWRDDTVVNKGIHVGQQVVVEGADKLVDGAKVRLYDGQKKVATVRKQNSSNQNRVA